MINSSEQKFYINLQPRSTVFKVSFFKKIKNHNEVPFHASQNGCNPKVYKQYMLERVWRKGNPLTLLVEMQTSIATKEDDMEIP